MTARRKPPVLCGDQRQAFDCITDALAEGETRFYVSLPAVENRGPIIAALAAQRRPLGRVLILTDGERRAHDLAGDLAGWLGARSVAIVATNGRVTAPVIVASTEILSVQLDRVIAAKPDPFGLVIIDEAHHAHALSAYTPLLEQLAQADYPPAIVGFANAARMDDPVPLLDVCVFERTGLSSGDSLLDPNSRRRWRILPGGTLFASVAGQRREVLSESGTRAILISASIVERRVFLAPDPNGSGLYRIAVSDQRIGKAAPLAGQHDRGLPLTEAQALAGLWLDAAAAPRPTTQEAGWRGDPPTQAQLNILRRWAPNALAKPLTRGTAGELISEICARRDAPRIRWRLWMSKRQVRAA